MKKLILALLATSILQGCAVAVIAGVGAGAASVNDRRTLGAQVDDQTIEIKAHSQIAKDESLVEFTQVQVISLNGTVLIVGQALEESYKQKIDAIIKNIQGVRKVHNQIRINRLTTVSTRTYDSWLTTKVKADFLADKSVDTTAIKVVTEDSEVFLMGLVTNTEANAAVNIARNINGVSRVYKAFEIK